MFLPVEQSIPFLAQKQIRAASKHYQNPTQNICCLVEISQLNL
jgi:hypothetical protein